MSKIVNVTLHREGILAPLWCCVEPVVSLGTVLPPLTQILLSE
jgi:hypothetical protein